jgi:hypothetical protein
MFIIVINGTNLKANPLVVEVGQCEEFTEFLITDMPSPLVPLRLFETCL